MLMKRILLALIVACIATSANAQLNVRNRNVDIETIATIQDSTQLERIVSLIVLKFDDDERHVHARTMDLGFLTPGKQDPFKTLLDLYNLCRTIKEGEIVEVEDHGIVPIKITKHGDGIALKWYKNDNVAYLSQREIMTLYNKLSLYN